MPKHTAIRSLWRIFRRNRLSFPSIARLLALAFAAAISFGPLAAEGQDRVHPKHSASDVASASDPTLWDKMAPFQSVFAQPRPADALCCYIYNGIRTCTTCQHGGGGGGGGGPSCPGGCDDGNPCTKDSCDTKTNTCVNEPTTGGKCDDGNVCTTNDTCSNGTCVGAPLANGTTCSAFSTFCSTSFLCENGTCTTLPCDDFNPCTLDTCDNLTGLCTNSPISCDDGNACTTDSCDPAVGCVNVPVTNGTSCPTGKVCTIGTCSNGTCGFTYPTGTSCDDGNPCTTNDTCSNGTCVGVPLLNGTICSGNLCGGGFRCENGTCIDTGNICDDGNICTVDSCDTATGLCVHTGVPEEAGPLVFLDQVTLQWDPAVVGALIYNTYRGTIPAEGLGGRSPVYDHVCFESGDVQLNGAQTSVDAEDPPVGTSFYYLVDGEGSCGEGTLGTATDGTPETPISFCPTPP